MTIALTNLIHKEEASDNTPKQLAAVKDWMRRNWNRYYHGEPDDLAEIAEKAGWEFVVDIETAQRLAAEVMKEKVQG